MEQILNVQIQTTDRLIVIRNITEGSISSTKNEDYDWITGAKSFSNDEFDIHLEVPHTDVNMVMIEN